MRPRSLFYMLLGSFFAALLAGAVAVGWADYKATIDHVEKGAEAAARAYAEHAGRNLQELRLGIDWVERSLNPQAPVYGLDPDAAAIARRMAGQLPGLSAVVVIGADARLKFSTTEAAAIGVDVSDREYFRAHQRGTREFIGSSIRARGTQQFVYTLSRRIERNGRFAGVAIASARVGRWNNIIAPLVPIPDTLLRLLRSDGSVIVAQRVSPILGGLDAKMEGDGSILTIPPSFVARQQLGDYGIMAEVAVPRGAALAAWRARTARVALGAALGLVVLSGCGFMGGRLLRREAAAMAALAERTRELETSTAELHRALEAEKLLLAELDHRVRNSLALAAGMLGLQKRETGDPETGRILDDARARILAIAKVHDRLHDGSTPSAVALDKYLEGLCGDLAAGAQLHCAISSDAIVVPSSQAVSLGLIVTELMLNVAKHAGGSDVRAEVGARATAGGLVITVRDYGRGVRPEFDPSQSSGLGMRIVSHLLSQLSGTLEIRGAEPGALFIIRIPLNRPHRQSDPAAREGDNAASASATGTGSPSGAAH